MATPADITSAATAYALATDLTANRAWTQIADYLVEPATRNGQVTVVNSQADVEGHALTTRALKWASGQLEAAATTGNRYTPDDLTALAGSGTVGKELIVGLVCDLAFWWLAKRRKPGLKPDQVSGAAEALDMLDQLRNGERIFPFSQTQLAGLPEVSALDVETSVSQAAEPVSVLAGRFFGQRNR